MTIRQTGKKDSPSVRGSRRRTVTVTDGVWTQTITLDLTDTEAHQLATKLLGHDPVGVGKNFQIWGKGEVSPGMRAEQAIDKGLRQEIDRREEAEYARLDDRDDELLPGLRYALRIIRNRFL
jgi:hypothetical protein